MVQTGGVATAGASTANNPNAAGTNPGLVGSPAGGVVNTYVPFRTYGFQFFEGARKAVELRRASGLPQTTIPLGGLQGIAGPEGQQTVNNPVPERYQLGPGDSLIVRYSSPTMEPKTAEVQVDTRGYVVIPETGTQVVARGQTLSQFESRLRQEMATSIRNVTLSVTLKELRTISIVILGDSYAPGTYQVPSSVTMFSALYASGGPADTGSMRRILLRRANTPTRVIDLYRFFIKGDASQDVPIQPGDVIQIEPSEARVEARGEVKRPAIYELLPTEHLKDLLSYAGGIRANAVAQKVSVQTVRPGVARQLIDVNLLRNGTADNPSLFDGDVVDVFSIRADVTNMVTIDGDVDQPRQFQITPGMRVSTLVENARGVRPDASLARADLFRLNPDYSLTLIPINLGQALRHDLNADVVLKPNDRLVVYKVSELQWTGEHQVEIIGAVQRPGAFVRAQGMTIRDLLIQAGGLLPDAYGDVAFLQRRNADGTPGQLFRLNIGRIANGDTRQNLVLEDRDVLRISTLQEFQAQPDQLVEIAGAVQRPGQFPRSANMTVRDLLQLAGNETLDASSRIFLQRTQPNGLPGQLFQLDLGRVRSGDPTQNLPLEPRDRLTLYTISQIGFVGPQTVEVSGAVQRPNVFPRSTNMRVGDLIALAGGVMPNTYLDRAYLQRTNPDNTPGPMLVVDLQAVLAGNPAANILLEDRDKLNVFTKEMAQVQGDKTVEITGSVQRPAIYPRSANMTVKDLIEFSGGLTPKAYLEKAWLQRVNPDNTQGPLVPLDLRQVMAGDPKANLVLQDRDRLSVYTKEMVSFHVDELVEIKGAVQRPSVFPKSSNMTLKDLFELAGGPLPTAADTVEIAHAYTPRGTPFQRIRLADILSGVPSANAQLQSGDVVILAEKSDVRVRPRVVTVLGQVAFPGPYLLTGSDDRLSNVIKRAGGLTANAFPDGAEFDRDPSKLATPLQLKIQPDLAETLRLVSEDEYKRAAALADMDRLRIVFSNGSSINGATSPILPGGIPGAQGPTTGISVDNALGHALSSEAATKARVLGPKELLPSGNLNVNLSGAVRHPGSHDDTVLQDGDVIIIPEMPTTVSVTGAVVRSSSIVFEEGKGLDYYLQKAAGMTNDADPKSTIIVRASGALDRYRKGVRIRAGDNILVPTKVQAIRLAERQNALATITQSVTSAGITLALIRSLTR
ncbi:polysaccharide export periplasmic protein [Fimbriimonas ginsengisoli Gsoil 348]|uniref:Polysaccharide export periplasmic protein n=2 Tax=Fimbriimonas ginsengisoli TaxID=1005039 RepID=A0A068NTG3_FIMGI|nr:polysaccharide export periplasmic protein [Fimbriimonas ginsengisoli Gsoil 348]